jgi:S1-C subfamily serine protease
MNLLVAGNPTKATWSLALCAAALLLQGCKPPTVINSNAPITSISNIKVDGVNYTNEAEALDAQRRGQDKVVDAVPHETDPVKGRVRIVLPDHDRLRPLIAQTEQQALKRVVTGEALEFLTSQGQQNLRQLANSIVRSGAFESAAIVEQNDIVDPAFDGADYLVWFQVRTALPNNTGPWIGAWLVERAGSVTRLGASVDAGTAPGAPRLASFVKSVRTAALRLGGRSAAGATAASLPANAGGFITVSGSGLVVGTRGYIITNEHVVRGCIAPRVLDSANASYPAHIAATDAANDLALLKIDHSWPQTASFRDGPEPRAGDPVIVAGYPLPGLVAATMSVTDGSVTTLAGPRGDSRLLQISAPVQPGNSGGPLLDRNGQVAGVVVGTLNGMVLAMATGILPQNVNFAIKAEIVRSFLDSNGVAYAHSRDAHEMSPADIGERARKFTVHVQCGRG